MTQVASRTPSLRVRKAERTRATLIETAVELCLLRGYEQVTVEQISAAADVAPRTFSRYFASKTDVFVAVLDDLAAAVAAELRALPMELGPLSAMRAALGTVLERAHRVPFHAFSAERLVRIIKVVTSSETLRRAAIDYRGPEVVDAMAGRMGVDADDRSLRLVMAVISVTVIDAFGELAGMDGALEPLSVVERVDEAFGELGRLAAELRPGR